MTQSSRVRPWRIVKAGKSEARLHREVTRNEREREREKHGSWEPFSPFAERHASVACSVLITGLSFRRTSPVGVTTAFHTRFPWPMEQVDSGERSFRVAFESEAVHFCPVSARISLMRLTVARPLFSRNKHPKTYEFPSARRKLQTGRTSSLSVRCGRRGTWNLEKFNGKSRCLLWRQRFAATDAIITRLIKRDRDWDREKASKMTSFFITAFVLRSDEWDSSYWYGI